VDIGKRIIEIRERQNISQYRLWKMSGVSQSALSDIEIGKKQPTVQTLDKILMALGVSWGEFFKESKAELPLEFHPLLDSIKQLDPDQIEALNQFIKSMTRSSATQDAPVVHLVPEKDSDRSDTLAAHREDNPMDDMSQAALDSVVSFKRSARKDEEERGKKEK